MLALEGERWKRVVWDLLEEPEFGIRNVLKYQLESGSPEAEALQWARDRINELCEREGLDLEG